MTLVMAWVRSSGGPGELLIASDSRLRGGHRWDVAPKVIPLTRGDCALAFYGVTELAYPILFQLVHAAGAWTKSATRGQTLEEAKGHFVRVMNRMLEELVNDGPSEVLVPSDVRFLLGGFSWSSQKFRLWQLRFSRKDSQFVASSVPWWRGADQRKMYVAMGEGSVEAKRRLIDLLEERGKLRSGGFDMEPLHVLSSIIDEANYPEVGGEPQLVKVYQHMNAVPVVLTRSEKRSVLGRPLLDYEKLDRYPSFSFKDDYLIDPFKSDGKVE